jgi:hypothetical protein
MKTKLKPVAYILAAAFAVAAAAIAAYVPGRSRRRKRSMRPSRH